VLGASLALRLIATSSGWASGLAVAGLGHALAFVLFGAVMARAVRRGR
jgi:dipeptide/tripeptide permease